MATKQAVKDTAKESAANIIPESLTDIEILDAIQQINIEQSLEIAKTHLPVIINYGIRFSIACLTLFIGWVFIGWITKRLAKMFNSFHADKALVSFGTSLVGILCKMMLLISCATQIGIETTSFVALLGAASLAVGLALQGSLSNFAGGVLMLIFRPFRVGDYIESGSVSGNVESIQVFHTKIKTVDNKTIIIPNSLLSNGILINYTSETTRRIEIKVGIDYKADIQKAREILLSVATKPQIMFNPAPVVYVAELADSAVIISLRVWVLSDDYWKIYFALNEEIKLALDKANINIPFPQRVITINN